MGLWNVHFILVLLVSVAVNLLFGSFLSRAVAKRSPIGKPVFIAAIAANILYLGFFKYFNFFVESVSAVLPVSAGATSILLPVGISFYTFMQIAWLTDIYRHGGYRYNFLTYGLYVTFFPYVISGPIAYHREIIPQLEAQDKKRINWANIRRGLFIFSIGLFKKAAIADTLAVIADGGFAAAGAPTFTEAWLTSLSYTMQLYFDFSGYTDMAIGVALLFNIDIPANFNSPYKSTSIQEFWRRWHITLSRFLRDYIYIPLGGNRRGDFRTLANLMVTFLIGGLWHGAAWTFVFWGFLHGAALCIQRLWSKTGIGLPKALAWFLTFNFINAAWVFFRAQSFDDALRILKGMAGLNGIMVSPNLAGSVFWQKLTAFGIRFGDWHAHLPTVESWKYFFCLALIPFVLLARNSNDLLAASEAGKKSAWVVSLLLIVGLLLLNQSSTFLYFLF